MSTPKTNWTTIPANARRLAKERKAKLAARKWIRPVSKKRKGRLAEYNAAAKAWLVGKTCLACWPMFGNYPMPATELHHQRGRLGPLLMDRRHWIPVCAECHRAIHDHPAVARAHGLLALAGEWNKPATP